MKTERNSAGVAHFLYTKMRKKIVEIIILHVLYTLLTDFSRIEQENAHKCVSIVSFFFFVSLSFFFVFLIVVVVLVDKRLNGK